MRNKVTKLDFTGQDFYIGIDVHKKQWNVTILGSEYEHKNMSQPAESKVLSDYLRRNFPGGTYHAVYEAGFSGFGTCRELRELGIKCDVVHAADVPTNDKEKKQKTDRSDSRKLAKMLRDRNFEGIAIPCREIESHRALNRQRFRLVKDTARVKNRVKSLLFQFGIAIPEKYSSASRHWSKSYLEWLRNLPIEETSLRKVLDNYLVQGEFLRKEVLSVTRQLRKLSQGDYFREALEYLLGIPGVGPITAMWILTELNDIERFPSLDSLCSFVGLVPSMHDSGDRKVTGKLIKRGRRQLKTILIEASWDAVRADPALMQKFNELTKRMNKNKAIIRIARKLLGRIRYVLIHKETYQTGIIC